MAAISALCVACRDSAPPEGAPTADPTPSHAVRRAEADAHLANARKLLSTYQTGPAEREVNAALDADPSHKEARRHKAVFLRNQARPDEAAVILESLVEDSPTSLAVRHLLAAVRFDQGRYQEAVTLFESLPAVERIADARAALVYVSALDEVERLQDAADTVAGLLVADPWFSDGYLHLAKIFARMGRTDRSDVWMQRYRADDSFRKSEYLARILENDGQPAAAQYTRGTQEMKRGRLLEAMHHFNEAIRLDRGYGAPYVAQGRLSCRIERPDDMLAPLRGLPPHGEIYGVLGEIHATAERYDEATKAYRQALVMQPNDERWLMGLAALEAARAAPSDDPPVAGRRVLRNRMRGRSVNRTLDELGRLAELYARHGQADRARELAIFVSQVAPGDQAVAQFLARLCNRPEDGFLRLHAFRQVLERLPEADAIREALIEQYLDLGVGLGVAAAEAQRLVSRSRTADRLVLLARTQIASGSTVDAGQSLKAARILAPGHERARQLLREIGSVAASHPSAP